MEQQPANIIGYRIKQRRQELKLTQTALAQLSGVSQTKISRYEQGEVEPTIGVVIALATALQTSIDWLAGRHDTPNALPDDLALTLLEKQALNLFRAKAPHRQSAIIEVIRWAE